MAKTKTHFKLKIRLPHVILDARGADPKVLEAMMPGLEEIDARVRVLGSHAKGLPHVFSLEEALEEGHIWVFLSDHLPKDFHLVVDRGIVPVMLAGLHKEAENYNPVQERGNAFLFPKISSWHIYGSLVRALENFNFSYDWENVRTQGRAFLEQN